MSALGQVVSLAISEAKGAPMVTVEDVAAAAGLGLVGDRYHGTRHRHVSVQAADDLSVASNSLGSDISALATRRNITVSHGPLPTQPGSHITIGDVGLEVVRIAAPCRVMDDQIAPGARAALRRRGGVICRVLRGGVISLGDAASAEA